MFTDAGLMAGRRSYQSMIFKARTHRTNDPYLERHRIDILFDVIQTSKPMPAEGAARKRSQDENRVRDPVFWIRYYRPQGIRDTPTMTSYQRRGHVFVPHLDKTLLWVRWQSSTS